MAEKTLQQRKEEADGIVSELQGLLDSWNTKKGQMETAFDKGQEIGDFYENTFVELKKLVEDENDGLDAVRINALSTAGRIDEIEEQTKEKAASAEKSESKIKEILTLNQTLKAELNKMLGVATDKTLSNSFDHRYKQLTEEKESWKGAMMVGFGIFSITTIITLFTFDGSLTTFLIEKIGILIPLALVSYLFYYEYKRIDKKAEEYAFKRTIASTLNSYAEILESKIVDDEKNSDFKAKILGFLLASMENVYGELSDEKSMELELKAKILEQELSVINKETGGKLSNGK